MPDSDFLVNDFNRDCWCLLGLPVDATTMSDTVNHIHNVIERQAPCFLSTPNLNFLIASLHDQQFRNSVVNSDWVIADGMPLIWLARLLDIPFHERVAGSGLIESLRQNKRDKPIKVFFFGGLEGIGEKSCEILSGEDSGLTCVGHFNPGFGSIEDMSKPEIINTINAANADFLIVSLGAKKGQAWIEHNREQLNAPVISHLGAVINFIAGTVSRAPEWVQKTGLEWLWRIYEEPGLFKRYWHDGKTLISLFFGVVLPYKRFLKQHKRLTLKQPLIQVSAETAEVNVKLSGSLTFNGLAEIRQQFASIAREGKLINCDFSGVDYCDSAFIGLLLILKKHQDNAGKKLKLSHLSPQLLQIFRYNQTEYLL
jgi:N-acetylglucosaminyldiphosphoundecaprenol N-acetyl-beta-D-mannosaminyltransferase